MTSLPRGFRLARARAGVAPLLALAVVAAIAVLLIGGLYGAMRAGEVSGVRDALASASDEAGSVTVSFADAVGSPEQRRAAIASALDALGAAGSLRIDGGDDAVFTLTVDVAYLSGDAVVSLARNWTGLGAAIADAAGESVTVSGGLGSTLSPFVSGIESRRGPIAIAMGVVLVLAIVVVAAAAAEPVRTRRDEMRLLRARGMSRAQLRGLSLAEAVPAALAGALVGAIVSWALTLVLSGLLLPWMIVFAAVILVTLTCAICVFVAGGRVSTVNSRGDLFVGIAAVIVLTVVAGLAAWQFWKTGTAVVTQAGGGRAVDPLIAAAPALVLVLFALLAIVITGPLSALAASVVSRRRAMIPAVSFRLASRRVGRHALTTGAVVFSSATLTLALVLSASLQALGALPEQLRVGADVRVVSVRDDTTAQRLGAVDGVEQSMRARIVNVRGADAPFSLFAIESVPAGRVLHAVDGIFDPALITQTLAPGAFGLPIPDAASEITATVRMSRIGMIALDEDEAVIHEAPWGGWSMPDLTVRLLLRNDEGRLREVVTDNSDGNQIPDDEAYVEGDRRDRWSVDLPLWDDGPWRLVAIDAWQGLDVSYDPVQLDLRLSAGGEEIDFSSFERITHGQLTADLADVFIVESNGWQASEPLVTRMRTPDAPRIYPAVMTLDLADSLNVVPGDQLSLRLASFPVTVDLEVARFVPFLPGVTGGAGVAVDLAALALTGTTSVEPNEVWLAAEHPSEVVATVGETFAGVVVDATDPAASKSAYSTAIAFLLTAGGAVALTLVVLLLRRSRGEGAGRETAILVALGMARRQAARVRVAEAASVITVGALTGVAGGLVAAHLVVPSLVRSSYTGLTEAFSVSVVVPTVLVAASAVAVLTLFIGVFATARTPRDLSATLREDG